MSGTMEKSAVNRKRAYSEKLITAEEAAAKINSGDDVVVAQCASEPQGCMARFHTAAPRVRDVRVFSVLTLKP
jgi:acyl-CoA hydrolase